MKLYLELNEIVAGEQEPEFIRSDVTDMTDAEKSDVQKAMEEIMSGKSYRLIKHYCRHDEDKPCSTELVKEV